MIITREVRPAWSRWRTWFTLPLMLGGALVFLLVLAALAAPLLAPYDPNDSPAFRIGGVSKIRPPLPPGTPGFVLGTDAQGRDMLSRLLYGTRYTLSMALLIALLRLALGVLLGTVAGYARVGQRFFSALTSFSSAVPGVFFGLLVIPLVELLGFTRFTPNQALADAAVFVVALGFTGWAETAVRCRIATRSLRTQPFIEAAAVVGQNGWGVLRRHILPNLQTILLIEWVAAIAAALLVIAELGFFSVFIGGSYADVMGSANPDPITAEWGSMFAKGLRLRLRAPWLVIEPLVAFCLSILAFTLLAEGLRRRV